MIIILYSTIYIFLFEGYSRRTLKYLERIVLFELIDMESIVDLMAISLETLRIVSRCSSDKELTKLICRNP